MYYCRQHGEPFIRDSQRMMWRCPEFDICKSGISDEVIYQATKDSALAEALAKWVREPYWARFMHFER